MGYAVKLLSVQQHGKESWIEEGLYTMAFHAICLAVVFPLFIGVAARNWCIFRNWWGKLLVIVAVLVAMALVVVLPEFGVNRAREKRSSRVDGARQHQWQAPRMPPKWSVQHRPGSDEQGK